MEKKIQIIEKQFEEIHSVILLHRTKALLTVNEESLLMSWEIGKIVSQRLNSNEWGSKVVAQLSEYLRTKDPTLKGYSRRNIYNMVMFYEAYSSPMFHSAIAALKLPAIVQTPSAQSNIEFVQTASAQMPQILTLTTFSNHMEILNRCKDAERQIFYILYAYREQLKYKELKRCIQNDTFGSLMGDKKNFSAGLKMTYPQSVSQFKDRAFVDFLNLPKQHSEKQLHKGILEHIKQFILELGKDFLFVDSEYPLQVGGSTFKVDLLFYHRGLQCLVAS